MNSIVYWYTRPGVMGEGAGLSILSAPARYEARITAEVNGIELPSGRRSHSNATQSVSTQSLAA